MSSAVTVADGSSDLVVDARGVVKSFGRTRALAGLDLQVERGEVHGFLGPNGAGKTTMLRILLGSPRIDAGTVRLLGGDPWRDIRSLHPRLAYVPGDVSLWPNLSGGEIIDLLGRLQGGHDPARRNRYLELFDLDPQRSRLTPGAIARRSPSCRRWQPMQTCTSSTSPPPASTRSRSRTSARVCASCATKAERSC